MLFVALAGVNPRGRVTVATARQRFAGLDVWRFGEISTVHSTIGLRTSAVRLYVQRGKRLRFIIIFLLYCYIKTEHTKTLVGHFYLCTREHTCEGFRIESVGGCCGGGGGRNSFQLGGGGGGP